LPTINTLKDYLLIAVITKLKLLIECKQKQFEAAGNLVEIYGEEKGKNDS